MKYNFQYCPKVVIFQDDKVLLCKRSGEEDFDDTYSFPGGKCEITDGSIENGITREIREELGDNIGLKVYRKFNHEVDFQKKSGQMMILPHYIAEYQGGVVDLNTQEYSDYAWFSLDEIQELNVIPNVIQITQIFRDFRNSEFYRYTSDVDYFKV